MTDFSKYLIDSIKTADMGSCWCGDCFCNVYADGSIKYTGSESWQKSDQHNPKWIECKKYNYIPAEIVDDCPNKPDVVKVWRSYHSNLKKTDWEQAILNAYHNPAAFMGSDDDWDKLAEIARNL